MLSRQTAIFNIESSSSQKSLVALHHQLEIYRLDDVPGKNRRNSKHHARSGTTKTAKGKLIGGMMFLLSQFSPFCSQVSPFCMSKRCSEGRQGRVTVVGLGKGSFRQGQPLTPDVRGHVSKSLASRPPSASTPAKPAQTARAACVRRWGIGPAHSIAPTRFPCETL